MCNSERKQEMLNLEVLLNDFVYTTKKYEQKRKKRSMKKDFLMLFSKLPTSTVLLWSFIAHLTSGIAYYTLKHIDVELRILTDLRSCLLVIYILSMLGWLVIFLIEDIKIVMLATKPSKKRNKIINKWEIEKSNRYIKHINITFSKQSVSRFEERLKTRIENLNKNFKNLDSYLPLIVIFLILAFKYATGIDTNLFGKSIVNFTGGLSVIAATSLVLKILFVNPEGITKYYQQFLLILKESQIERVK